MSRLPECFQKLRQKKCSAFIPFVEAFDPDRETSLNLLRAMPRAGADIIEVGMPFSDPSADGPAIQIAGRRALRAGASIKGVLELIAEFRREDDTTPIVLMGYVNPIERFGYDKFCQAASRSGVDGLIIVDLPPDESASLDKAARQNAIDVIRLLTPVTRGERLDYVLSKASGFLYYVSIVGVTGTRTATEEALRLALEELHRKTSLPIVIGFGIKTPQKAAQAARCGEGVVVGSALVRTLTQSLTPQGQATADTIPQVLSQLEALAQATHRKNA